ncbi:MAG: dockerin type I repeat-containing protein [Prevotella sp.]|nr:dockerin type I repeat-containing protein [Prevotella sp.]
MKKILPILVVILSLSFSSANAQTKDNPYTVAQLLAQKDALAASGETVWVKADLKGLGEDGTKTNNADTEDAEGKTVRNMAALFADATGEFVAYSWQILGKLDIADLTNTKDLLIALTYGTAGHPYGNSAYPQYASSEEPTDPHFSLGEVHGALKLDIKNGFRGYHIASSYLVPREIVAARVSSGYTAKNGATVSYGYYDGAEEGKNYIINKNTALVLLAYAGTYDFVLSADYYEQINSNSLNGGETAGVNTIPMKNNALRYHYRFVANGDKVGFERNCEESTQVRLDAKDEVYMTINGNDNHFYGNWTWETDDKNWISWAGQAIADFHDEPVATLKGDVNADGYVDVADISTILTVMADSGNDPKADVNVDGTVDVADISSVLTIMAEN